MKEIKVNKFTKLNYDELLSGISAVLYMENSNGFEPNRIHMAHLVDRQMKTDKGDLWYKDCFGNCLIALRYAKTTNKLYLINENTFKKIGHDNNLVGFLENNSVITIIREE